MAVFTILGANGNIAKVLSSELRSDEILLRQVSRNPTPDHPGDELVKADLLNATQVLDAVKGSEIVFLVAGITYKTAIWKHDWPIIMRHTLDACITHGAKLVFFDNMYALDPAQVGHLTEETPLNPQSEKGKVRKQILDMLWTAVKSGKLSATRLETGR